MKAMKIKYLILCIAFLKTAYANVENKAPTTPTTPWEVQELLDAWTKIEDVKALQTKISELIWHRYNLQQEIGVLKGKNHKLQDELKAKEIVHDENARLNKRISDLEVKNEDVETKLTKRKLIKETTEEIWDPEEVKDFMEKSKAIQRAIRSIEVYERLLLAISVPDFHEMWQAVEKLLKTEGMESVLDLDSPSAFSQSSRKRVLYHYVRWRYGLHHAKTGPNHVQNLRTTMKRMNLTEHEYCLGLSNLFASVQAWPQCYFSPTFRPSPADTLKAIAAARLNETFVEESVSLRAIETLLLVQKQEHDDLIERIARTKPTLEPLPENTDWVEGAS